MEGGKEGKGRGRLITLECRGRGTFANQNWIVRSGSVTEFELVSHGEGVTAGDVETKGPTTRQIILERLAIGERDNESLCADAGVSYSAIRSALAELTREGLVVANGRIDQRKVYALSQTALASREP